MPLDPPEKPYLYWRLPMQSQTAIDSPLPLLRLYQSRVLRRSLAISGDSARGNYFYEVSSPPFWPGGATGDERRGGRRSQRNRNLTHAGADKANTFSFHVQTICQLCVPADLSFSLKESMQEKKLQKTRKMVHETHRSSPREKFVTWTISVVRFFLASSTEEWRSVISCEPRLQNSWFAQCIQHHTVMCH